MADPIFPAPAELGIAFLARRTKLGLSLRDCTEILGIDFNTLSRFERGVSDCRASVYCKVGRWLADQGSLADA